MEFQLVPAAALPDPDLLQVVKPDPENLPQFWMDLRFQVIVGSTERETIPFTKNSRAPFSNLKVRQAIAHAIDRQAIIDGAM